MRLPRVPFAVRRMMVAVGEALSLAAFTPPRRLARLAALRDYHSSRLASRMIRTNDSLSFTNHQGVVLYRYGTPDPSPEQFRRQV